MVELRPQGNIPFGARCIPLLRMETKGKFLMIVTNKTMFSGDNFSINEKAFKRVAQVSKDVKKLLLITKVDNDEQQKQVLKILKSKLPGVPEHHFLFCEFVHSIYSLVRQFNDPVDIVIDCFQESYDETAKFLPKKYYMATKPLEELI